MYPKKPKIYIVWLFTEKAYPPLSYSTPSVFYTLSHSVFVLLVMFYYCFGLCFTLHITDFEYPLKTAFI